MASMILWCLSLIVLSLILDGWDRAIIAKPGFNPRKAYNIIYNKKISDLIRQVQGKNTETKECLQDKPVERQNQVEKKEGPGS